MSEVSCVLSLQTVHMTDVSLFCNILWGEFLWIKVSEMEEEAP